jgi:succinate-semialdehyde dehydrogenase/glutarate-semialdehyde dehydrogenase
MEFSVLSSSTFCCANIMVGNTVVKHASMVPQCAIAIEDLFNEVGAPNGLYTNLLILEKSNSFS